VQRWHRGTIGAQTQRQAALPGGDEVTDRERYRCARDQGSATSKAQPPVAGVKWLKRRLNQGRGDERQREQKSLREQGVKMIRKTT